MLSVEDALARILEQIAPLPSEQIGLESALGRTLAEDVAARVTQPPKAVSAMDGYAVRSADVAAVPATLQVVADIPAGQSYETPLQPGEAARIFTGAPLPPGADAIVIQEDTEADGRAVVVKEPAQAGAYVRPAGLDFECGQVLLHRGRTLTARDVGLAAAMNVPWLPAVRRPRVAILPTGDEVVMPGEAVGPNQIVSSNGHALRAFVSAEGGEPLHLGIALDNEQSLRRMAAAAKGADLLVTTGGASVGDHDLVQEVLGKDGLDIDFWRIAMRPGKPLMFGHIRSTPMLGLPGNPVSAMVCGLLFLRPILRRMLGREDVTPVYEIAELGESLEANDRRQDYLRATLQRRQDGSLVASPYRRQDSSMLSFLAAADCLIVRAPHAPPVEAGAPVPILRLCDSAYSI
ncbi:MAG: molybdopterin molybdotransferase MoeA [Alphaproteobacteria bacterium]|nr:molybdopterin molybdotransferase MoeA [Alphaproteobacteria bacterium]